MFELNFTQAAFYLFGFASLVSLFLILALGLGQQVESVGIVWIRAIKRIRTERQRLRKPSEQPRVSMLTTAAVPSESLGISTKTDDNPARNHFGGSRDV